MTQFVLFISFLCLKARLLYFRDSQSTWSAEKDSQIMIRITLTWSEETLWKPISLVKALWVARLDLGAKGLYWFMGLQCSQEGGNTEIRDIEAQTRASNLEMLAALVSAFLWWQKGSRSLRPDAARVQRGTTRICPTVVSLPDLRLGQGTFLNQTLCWKLAVLSHVLHRNWWTEQTLLHWVKWRWRKDSRGETQGIVSRRQ